MLNLMAIVYFIFKGYLKNRRENQQSKLLTHEFPEILDAPPATVTSFGINSAYFYSAANYSVVEYIYLGDQY